MTKFYYDSCSAERTRCGRNQIALFSRRERIRGEVICAQIQHVMRDRGIYQLPALVCAGSERAPEIKTLLVERRFIGAGRRTIWTM